MWEFIKSNTNTVLQLITLSTIVFTSLTALYYKIKNTQKITQDINSIKDEIKTMKDYYTKQIQTFPPIIESQLFLWFDYYKRYNGLKMEDITRMATTLSAVKSLYSDIKYVEFLQKELIIMYKKQKGGSYGFSNSK